MFTNSLAGLCLTKLDVLDGLPEIKICVGYRLDGKVLDTPPLLIDRFGECEPVYESRGRAGASRRPGATSYDALPKEAQAYLAPHRGARRRPDRHRFDGAGARRRHHAAPSVRLSTRLVLNDNDSYLRA